MFRTLMTAAVASAITVLALTLARRPQSFVPPPVQCEDLESLEARSRSVPTPHTGPAAPRFDPARPIDKLDFDNTPLEKALDAWREQAGCALCVSWSQFSSEITRQTPVTMHIQNLSAENALQQILSTLPEPLSYAWDGGTVMIAEPGSCVVTKVYDVRDLVIRYRRFELALESLPFKASDGVEWPQYIAGEFGLKEVISEINHDSWIENGGSFAQMTYWGGFLVVTQLPETHRKIDSLLATLREAQK